MSNRRCNKLVEYLDRLDLEAFFIASKENRQYFTGFTGSNGFVLITPNDKLLMTDSRYTRQAKEQARDFEVITYNLSHMKPLKDMVKASGVSKIGYETKLVDDYTVRSLKEALNDVEWVPTEDAGITIRKIKDDDEIGKITKAIEIADKALEMLVPKLKVGMTEKDIQVELEYNMQKLGSASVAFPSIVASGTNGAMPHAEPSDKKVSYGDMVVMDFGANYQGYMSDITRTLWFGEPSKRMYEIFDIVEQSQRAAIDYISPGKKCMEIDKAHRDVFLECNVEQYSLKGLGHGVGLNIHEYPRVVMKNEEIIENNMIFTIEPGLYIPDVGGVRTEDIVIVKDNETKVLTASPHKIVIDN